MRFPDLRSFGPKPGPGGSQSCTVGHGSAKRCGSSWLFGSNFPEIYAHSQLAARAGHGHTIHMHPYMYAVRPWLVKHSLIDEGV